MSLGIAGKHIAGNGGSGLPVDPSHPLAVVRKRGERGERWAEWGMEGEERGEDGDEQRLEGGGIGGSGTSNILSPSGPQPVLGSVGFVPAKLLAQVRVGLFWS